MTRQPASRHRGRLITLDRVTRMEPGERATAVRNVPVTLDVFTTHFPRMPVLPGVLILGSMGELAALLLGEETGRSWRLAGARNVRYRHFVQPGDQLELTVELEELTAESGLCKATARVEGKPVTTARQLRMVPAPASGEAP